MSASGIPLTISWFPMAMPKGPAIGDQERTTWDDLANVFQSRREGDKDGPCFSPARYTPEADGRHVRRLGANLAARTAVVLDCETHKSSGEVPPPLDEVEARVRREGWAAVVYTTHNHRPQAPRYRIVVPLSTEIDYELPAPEVMAATLGLDGVTDTSKYNPASLFYLPSAEPDKLDHHDTVTIEGNPIDAAWMREAAGAILAGRQAEQGRIATEARAKAENRRQDKIAAGFDPDDSLIEKLRSHFDLPDVLLSHGYSHRNGKYRHPNSQSGCFGADIKTYGGIERVYSHNAGDPLHRDNLPSWCGAVTALDAIDTIIILDYGGDRTKALADLAQRFGLTKTEQRKTLAALLFKLIRDQQEQDIIEACARDYGAELGLTRTEVREVRTWVSSQIIREAELVDGPPNADGAKAAAAAAARRSTLEAKKPDPPENPPILTAAEFMAGYVAPDFIVDGILQRGRLYALTSPTGHGKTAVALYLACLINAGRNLGNIEVTQGNVVFLEGENPDDLRCRVYAAEQFYGLKPEQMPRFLPGNFPVTADQAEKLKQQIDKLGCAPVLVVVDTAAAYFDGDDDNHNVQMGAYARQLRVLTGCKGNPAVLVLAHPVKNPDRDNLLPRGGGAFLNELDGNLTLWSESMGENTTLHWQGKIRGADFPPVNFVLSHVRVEKLKDHRNRPTVSIVAALQTDSEAEAAAGRVLSDQDNVLELLRRKPGISLRKIAITAGWTSETGSPHTGKVHRLLKALKDEKLVAQKRGKWQITEAGKRELKPE